MKEREIASAVYELTKKRGEDERYICEPDLAEKFPPCKPRKQGEIDVIWNHARGLAIAQHVQEPFSEPKAEALILNGEDIEKATIHVRYWRLLTPANSSALHKLYRRAFSEQPRCSTVNASNSELMRLIQDQPPQRDMKGRPD
jgi:hypothetical protein